MELAAPRPRPHDPLTGLEVDGRQPDTDTKHQPEIAERFLFGGNAVQRGQRRQQLACGPDDTMPAMNRLIHPLLQCHVELLGLGREDQYVVSGQPQMLGARYRGDWSVESTVGRSER